MPCRGRSPRAPREPARREATSRTRSRWRGYRTAPAPSSRRSPRATTESWCSPSSSCTDLTALDQLLRVLPQCRRARLGGVAQPLRGLAHLVQLLVALVTRSVGVRGAQGPACAPRGLAEQLGQHDGGRLCGPFRSAAGRPAARRRRRAARGTGRRPAPRRPSAPAWPRRVAKNRVVRAATGPRAISGGSAATSALIRCLLHLEVASTAQLAGQPAQLDDEVVGACAVEQGAEGLEGAAHPSARHPHLVDTVRDVAADLRIRGAHRVGLLVQVGEHDLTGGRLRGDRGRRRDRRKPVGEHPGQLRCGCRALHTGPGQRFLDPVQQRGGAVLGELDLDLGPLDGARCLTALPPSTPSARRRPVTRSSVTVATAAPRVVGQRPLLGGPCRELDDRLQRGVPVGGAAQRDQRRRAACGSGPAGRGSRRGCPRRRAA